ncbi:MAG: hypothetical protein IPN36_14990 [Bacteroidetes bacterium]|nr:hypothetical protein [Bacteroidota bacterium]
MIRLNAFLRLFFHGYLFSACHGDVFLAIMGLTGIFRVVNEVIKGRALLLIFIVFFAAIYAALDIWND